MLKIIFAPLFFPLKSVSIVGDSLYVANYLKDTFIPLSDVDRVREFAYANLHFATIHLKAPSAFGLKIPFIPISFAAVSALRDRLAQRFA